ncbi:MAG: AsmA-like C-terminal region-containing protein [Bacteroidales bacterium]|nr:AsmA-like C-terminal region-containing protein [Bacteroidales bacterium]
MESNALNIEQQPKKKRKIKKILLIIASIFLALLLSAFALAYVFEDKIADFVLKELYKSIRTEVKHKDVSFSLIRKFPMTSLKIEDLHVQGFSEQQDVLSASYVYLQFNFLDVLTSNYKLKRIEINNATLRLKEFQNEEANWMVFVSKDSTSKNWAVNLDAVILKKLNVNYESLSNQVCFSSNIQTLTARGDFEKETLDLRLSSNLRMDSLKVDTSFSLYNKEFTLSTRANMDIENDVYTFHKTDMQLGRLRVKLDFDLHKKNMFWVYEIKAQGNDLALKDILYHIPTTVKQNLKGYELSGLLNAKLNIKGSTEKNKKLDINSKFSFKKGSIYNVQNDIGVINLRLAGTFYSNGINISQSSCLNITSLHALLNKKNISGNISIKNFVNPYIKLHLESDVHLEDWHRFIPENYVYCAKGKALINVDFENQFKNTSSITIQDFRNASIHGKIEFSNVDLQLTQGEAIIESLSGQMDINDQVLLLHDLNGSINRNTFVLNGEILQFFDYLFTDDTPMLIVADLSSPSFNLSEFLSKKDSSASDLKTEDKFELDFPPTINFDLKLVINNFVFDRFKAKNVYGDVSLKNNEFKVNSLKLNSLNGDIALSGYAQKQKNNTFVLYCSAKLNHTDVQQMFYTFHNFGQSNNGLTDRNIRGVATSTILFKATASNTLSILPESVNTIANITITDGELKNFKPLESLSKFVELEDLRNIRFATLSNCIKIENKEIHIPEMSVKNNALDLILSGNQGFNGDIDYTVRVNMSELLSKKFQSKKRNREDFGEVVDDGTGNVNIFITATGNLDNPCFKWSGRKQKSDIKEKISTQKEEINVIFKEEKEKKSQAKKKEEELNDYKKKSTEIEIDDDW